MAGGGARPTWPHLLLKERADHVSTISLYSATTGVYPERSRRAPTQVWRGRPRPRKEPFGWRSHFGNRFVGHVHSSLTRNSAATHSGIGDGGRGRPPHMATLAPKGKGRPCFHDQPLLWRRRLEFTLSEAEGLPHRCGAGALARENSPSAGDPILETDLSAMFIRH